MSIILPHICFSCVALATRIVQLAFGGAFTDLNVFVLNRKKLVGWVVQ